MSVPPQSLSGRILSSQAVDRDAQGSNAQRVRQLQDSVERAECFDLADRLDLVAGVLEWLGGGAADPQALLNMCAEVVENVEETIAGDGSARGTGKASLPGSMRSPGEAAPKSSGLFDLMGDRGDYGLAVSDGKLLGQILIELGILKAEAVERGLKMQRGSGRRIGEVLVELGECTWEQIERGVEVQRRLKRAVGMRCR